MMNATNHLKNIHKLRNRITNLSHQQAYKEKKKQARDSLMIPSIQLSKIPNSNPKAEDVMLSTQTQFQRNMNNFSKAESSQRDAAA